MALPNKRYADLAGDGGSDIAGQVGKQQDRFARRMRDIGKILIVSGGKGGVGKSTVAACLAATLARSGSRVGLLDADLDGASAARILGVADGLAHPGPDGLVPPVAHGVRVMSTEVLRSAETAPLSWRGTDPISESAARATVVRELMTDTAWGTLDCLLVDMPPRADLSLLPTGAQGPEVAMLAVTVPHAVSLRVVSRALTSARDAGMRVLGLVVNMAYLTCEPCGHRNELGDLAGARAFAAELGLGVLAELPWHPDLASAAPSCVPLVLDEGPSADAYSTLAASLWEEK